MDDDKENEAALEDKLNLMPTIDWLMQTKYVAASAVRHSVMKIKVL